MNAHNEQHDSASPVVKQNLTTQPAAAQEAVAWPNECSRTVPEALRFLANHERPSGGEDNFNSLHLIQLASEIERMASKPLYAAPVTAAPGIDLGQFRQAVEYWKLRWANNGDLLVEANRLLTLIDASPKGGSEAQPMFYIQDTRGFVGNCPMWWGPDGRGYVTRLDEAGRYTEEEAIRQNKARDTDIPWPCDEIDKLARPTVDFQHMRPRSERLAELAAQAGDAEVQP